MTAPSTNNTTLDDLAREFLEPIVDRVLGNLLPSGHQLMDIEGAIKTARKQVEIEINGRFNNFTQRRGINQDLHYDLFQHSKNATPGLIKQKLRLRIEQSNQNLSDGDRIGFAR